MPSVRGKYFTQEITGGNQIMMGCLCRCIVVLYILREWHMLQNCNNGGTIYFHQ